MSRKSCWRPKVSQFTYEHCARRGTELFFLVKFKNVKLIRELFNHIYVLIIPQRCWRSLWWRRWGPLPIHGVVWAFQSPCLPRRSRNSGEPITSCINPAWPPHMRSDIQIQQNLFHCLINYKLSFWILLCLIVQCIFLIYIKRKLLFLSADVSSAFFILFIWNDPLNVFFSPLHALSQGSPLSLSRSGSREGVGSGSDSDNWRERNGAGNGLSNHTEFTSAVSSPKRKQNKSGQEYSSNHVILYVTSTKNITY